MAQRGDTADLFGLTDRALLRAGAFADVNVIGLDGLTLSQPFAGALLRS